MCEAGRGIVVARGRIHDEVMAQTILFVNGVKALQEPRPPPDSGAGSAH